MARMPLTSQCVAKEDHSHRSWIRFPWSWLAPCFISLTLAISISDAQEKILDKPFSLDHLKSNLIPAEDRIALHPKELVAILGSERGRGWGTIGRFTFSPDGKTIACVAGSWVLYLWDATTLVEREAIEITPRPGSPGIFELAFSPDGKRLALTDWDTIWLCELGGKKPRQVAKLRGHENGIDNLAFSPDGKTLVSVGIDNTTRLWDLSATPPKEKSLLDSGGYSLSISQDGKYLAIGEDGSLILWDITEPEPKEMASVKIKAEYWKICGFMPDNKTVITHEGVNLRFWRKQGEKLACSETLKLPGGFLALSADSKWLVSTSGNEEGFIHLLKLENTKYQVVAKYGPDRGFGWHCPIALSSDGKKLAYVHDVAIQILDTGTKKTSPLLVHEGLPAAIDSIAFSPDGKVLATGASDGTIRLWDMVVDRPKDVNVLGGHSAEVSSLAFSPNGKTLASASKDETVRLWDMAGPKARELAVLKEPKTDVSALTFGPKGEWLAVGYSQIPDGHGAAFVWDLSGEKPQKNARLMIGDADNDYVWSLASFPDGKTLVTAGVNGVLIWDLRKPQQKPTRFETLWGSIAVSPDGNTLAGSGGDDSIALMNFSQDPPKRLPDIEWPGKAWLTSAAFSRDGKKLAAVEHGGTVAVWDFSSRKKLHEWKFPGTVQGIAFAADGRHLATANANGTVYILRLGEQQGGD